MDTQQWVAAVLGAVLGGGVAWGVAMFVFGRQLKAAAARQDKLDKAREFAAQQVSQARRQIETLQKELGELRQQQQASRPSPAWAEAPAAVEMPILGLDSSASRKPPADGFADTQVILPHKR